MLLFVGSMEAVVVAVVIDSAEVLIVALVVGPVEVTLVVENVVGSASDGCCGG